ncbi:MAG: divalent-cation tolerance protein CutA [Deltaproteobacteria bacterium]|nr:divalent-cation tolerance protein CutA [Deltaproteobacteria bacterium]
MSEYMIVYITTPNMKRARKIAKLLVEEKLAACVNLIKGMESLYEWKGKLRQEEEVLMLVKTRQKLFATLQEKVLSIHSYDVPCIVGFPLTEGNESYLNWLKEQTSDA